MTVNVTYTFNLGNSPAAMIYKDTTHECGMAERSNGLPKGKSQIQ